MDKHGRGGAKIGRIPFGGRHRRHDPSADGRPFVAADKLSQLGPVDPALVCLPVCENERLTAGKLDGCLLRRPGVADAELRSSSSPSRCVTTRRTEDVLVVARGPGGDADTICGKGNHGARR
jgi:hypothetical protein